MTVKVFAILLLAASALGSVPAAQARDATAKGSVTLLGQKFPSSVAGYKGQGSRDFESRTPGLGYSYRYQRGPRQWADVYVYDKRRSDLPERYDATVSSAELAAATGDIARAAQVGAYRSATPRGEFSVPASGQPRLDCASFLLVAPDGEERDSIACLTNRSGKFIKVRLDGPRGSLTPKTVSAFLQAWVKP